MGARGETTLQVGEKEYRILFTNRAIAEAEAAMSKSIIAVAREPGIADVGQLLAAGLEAARREDRTGGRATTIFDAYRIMDEVGFAAAAKAVLESVAAVLSYNCVGDNGGAADGGAADNGPNP